MPHPSMLVNFIGKYDIIGLQIKLSKILFYIIFFVIVLCYKVRLVIRDGSLSRGQISKFTYKIAGVRGHFELLDSQNWSVRS